MKASAYLSYAGVLISEIETLWAGEHACKTQPAVRKIIKALNRGVFQDFAILSVLPIY
jgi:hypothetical protein